MTPNKMEFSFKRHQSLNLFSILQVAQHLANTFGDKAFEVAKVAQVTGKRWPIVGKRLVSEFPYIESEVRNVLCCCFSSSSFLAFLLLVLKVLFVSCHIKSEASFTSSNRQGKKACFILTLIANSEIF